LFYGAGIISGYAASKKLWWTNWGLEMVGESRRELLSSATPALTWRRGKTARRISQITFSGTGIRAHYIGIQKLCDTFFVIHTVHFVMFRIFLNIQQNAPSKTQHNIHYISGANSYMFRQQGAIIREFINNRVL
jgi:hypothetical protein